MATVKPSPERTDELIAELEAKQNRCEQEDYWLDYLIELRDHRKQTRE